MSELLSRLRTAAVVMENLPEDPGYNGSRLIIDDTEAEEIAKAIDAGVTEIEKLRELVRLIFESTMPYRDNGECVFIDKVTDMWKELTPNGEVRGASQLAGEASSAEGATSTGLLEGATEKG